MLKFYRSLKIIILVFIIILISAILFYENTKNMKFNYLSVPVFQPLINNYVSIKNFILDDPYNKNILSGIEKTKIKFKNLFASLNNGVSSITSEKYFYNNIFIYLVSKKMDDMDRIVNNVISKNPSFKDLIIIDKDKNILYKYGSSPFTAEYFMLTNNSEIRFINDDLGIIKRFSDPTLDYEIEVIALFNQNSVLKELKDMNFPAFFVMNNKIYKNSYPLPGIFDRLQNDLFNERKYYTGLKVVEMAVVSIDNFNIGTLGLTYSSRSLGSTLLIMLKFIIFLILITLIFTFDKLIETKLKLQISMKKNKKIQKEKQIQNEADVAVNDANLEWFSHYIQEAEGKK